MIKELRFILIILINLNYSLNISCQISSFQSGDWTQTSTWAGGVVPTRTDNVIIKSNHTVEISSGRDVRSIEIESNATLKLSNGSIVQIYPGFIATQNFVNNGWFSIIGEKKYGGQDLPLSAVVMINEIWHSTNISFATNNMLTQGAVELLESHGNEKQKEYYLPNLISGKWSGTMNLTEPHAGSDLSSIKTKAIEKDKQFLIKGTKIYITHGDQDMSDNIIHLV